MKKRLDKELDPQQKIVVYLLLGSALVALVLLIGFISPTLMQGLRSIFTRSDPEWIYGNASDYLPGVGELPPGFHLVEAESGPIELDHGNFHRSTFFNPDHEQQHREVKVLYSAGIYENIEITTDAYMNFSDPDYYAGNTVNKVFPLADFTNVDSAALLFSQDMSPTGALSISYTLVFRYRNFTATVSVQAPVRDYFDEYAMQMQSRLKNAAVYYATRIIDRLPVDQVSNVSQPPFGGFTLSTQEIIVEPTRQLLIEATHTFGP